MNPIRFIALDCDGVLLKDTFSPVIKQLIEDFGGIYNAEAEKNLFSRSRKESAEWVINYCRLNLNHEELTQIYFQKRKDYIALHGTGLEDGTAGFLKQASGLPVVLIAYGGLDENYFSESLGEFAGCFDRYICTDSFRPGLKEIIHDVYHQENHEVLFVDDVNTVALEAKRLNIPFIGCCNASNYQKQEMKENGVRFQINTLKELSLELLGQVNQAAALGQIW